MTPSGTLNDCVQIGDPEVGCASYTRFVLPFAYELEALAEGSAAPSRYFREASAGAGGGIAADWLHAADPRQADQSAFRHRSRHRYFTVETAHVLYGRARWFVLEDTASSVTGGREWTRLTLKLDADHAPLVVVLRHPALLLFEYEEPALGKRARGEALGGSARGVVLRSGFLIIEAFFPSDCPESGDAEREPERQRTVSLGQLLEFNELFRYWRKPYFEHEPGWLRQMKEQLGLDSPPSTGVFPEDEPYSHLWRALLNAPLRIGSERLYGLRTPPPAAPGPCRTRDALALRDILDIYADDRAFVATCVSLRPGVPPATCAGLDAIKALATEDDPRDSDDALGAWVKLVNVDRRPGSKEASPWLATRFEREWVRARSYLRWAHYCTVYGFTPHSIAMLAVPSTEPPLWRYFGQYYFDATLLLLYLRVTLFRFSRALAELSTNMAQASRDCEDQWAREFSEIHGQFTQFENLYQFPLLSNQQQGLEMYALQRTMMDIDALYEEVRSEIKASDEMLDTRLNSRRSESAELLNAVLAAAVVVGLAIAWLAVPQESQGWCGLLLYTAVFGLAVLALLLVSPGINRCLVRVTGQSPTRRVIGAIACLVALSLFLYGTASRSSCPVKWPGALVSVPHAAPAPPAHASAVVPDARKSP